MEKKTGMAGYAAVTVLLVLIAALFFGVTVRSETEAGAGKTERYYQEKERKLTREIRTMLEREGFKNSGVMLTRVVEEDGSRAYTVTIHHGGIDGMEETEKDALLRRLAELDFEEERCSFCHKFLLDE